MAHRILIADDEQAILRLLRKELERDGSLHICGEAHDGPEAVAKASELRPDLIILDLSMPILNGIDAARHIKSTLPSVPIILFTLSDFPEVRTQAEVAGIHAVVAKRNGIAHLQAAIASALDDQKKSQSAVVLNQVGARDEAWQTILDKTSANLAPAISPDNFPPKIS